MGLFKKLFVSPSIFHSAIDAATKGKREAAKQHAAALEVATGQMNEAKKAAEIQAYMTREGKLLNERALTNMQNNAAKVAEANNAQSTLGRLSNVLAGGTVASMESAVTASAAPKRKKQVSTVSDSLGIRL